MKEKFDNLNSLKQINDFYKTYSSEDGEGVDFELKGSSGKIKLDKELKKILAKEICAFANTYGGILCYHFGEKENIRPFNDEDLLKDYTPIENWLKDSLEPRLMGMDLKRVENVLLIYIPQSKTKPHRTTSEKQYCYRNCTSSIEMPEIMISSMYRSQDYLFVDIMLAVHKSNTDQLQFTVFVNNQSNISGSKIKIQVQFFNKIKTTKYLGVTFNNEPNLNTSNYSIDRLFNSKRIPIRGNATTDIKFSENILYPYDKIILSGQSKLYDELTELKYLIVRIDVMMKETKRNTKYFLVKLNETENCPVLMKSEQSELPNLISKYLELDK